MADGGFWDKAKQWLSGSLSEKRKREKDKKSEGKYGNIGRGSDAYSEAERELEDEYNRK